MARKISNNMQLAKAEALVARAESFRNNIEDKLREVRIDAQTCIGECLKDLARLTGVEKIDLEVTIPFDDEFRACELLLDGDYFDPGLALAGVADVERDDVWDDEWMELYNHLLTLISDLANDAELEPGLQDF